jgi:O-antigen ligase
MDSIVVSGEQTRDDSAAIRLEIWAAAWEMFKTKPFGVGVGQFQWQVKKYSDALENRNRDAHNSFVLCAGEVGLPGLLVYIATLALAWMTLNQVSRQARNHLAEPDMFEWLVLANRLALVVYVVSGLFVSRFYTEGMWWLIILPVCLSRAVESEMRLEAREELELQAALQAYERQPLPALAGIRIV